MKGRILIALRRLFVFMFFAAARASFAEDNANTASPAEQWAQLAQNLQTTVYWVDNAYIQLVSRLKDQSEASVSNVQKLFLQSRNQICGINVDPADRNAWLQAALSDSTKAYCALTETYEQSGRIKAIYSVFANAEYSVHLAQGQRDPNKHAMEKMLHESGDKVHNTYSDLAIRLQGTEKTALDAELKKWTADRNQICKIEADPRRPGKWLQAATADYNKIFCVTIQNDYEVIRLRVLLNAEMRKSAAADAAATAAHKQSNQGSEQALQKVMDQLDVAYSMAESGMNDEKRADMERQRQAWLQERNKACGIDTDPSLTNYWIQAVTSDPTKTECALTESYIQVSRVRGAR